MKRSSRGCGTFLVSVCGLLAAFVTATAAAEEFSSDWPASIERVWIGPDYWANRLQDWRLKDGRLECVEASSDRPTRTIQLLTAALGSDSGTLSMSVRTGAVDATPDNRTDFGRETWTGFLIGAGGPHVDYRLTALVHHRPAEDGGLVAAVDGTGRIVFRDFTGGQPQTGGRPLTARVEKGRDAANFSPDDLDLTLELVPTGDNYRVTLTAVDHRSRVVIARSSLDDVAPDQCDGCLALVSHRGPDGGRNGYWFRDWRISGSKVTSRPERQYGPILCAMHTLHRNTLKMTAQLPPLGEHDTQTARLEIREGENDSWRQVAEGRLERDSFTIPFRVDNWDATADRAYRIVYDLKSSAGQTGTFTWSGRVRKEPVDQATLVLAAFTGHRIFTGDLKWNSNGIWFPHNDLVNAVRFHRPDLLFFSGDQIYESDLTGAHRKPLEKAILDYLDKWYRWCWGFADLARDVPCVAIPDDHDVYHGNIWGAGGRRAETHDDGGYTMPARFVNMVQRSQTSHLPDPYDPRPVEQGIGVYYTGLTYGGVSFGIVEDRKWKSSPTPTIPAGRAVNGWFQNPDFDPSRQADVAGAQLLGPRQLQFLQDWSADWSGGVWMKVVLSQTIFANVATLPKDAASDKVVPQLKRYPPDFYPDDDKLAADADSNGWPQSGRNRALAEMRRGFALHVAGDQHLGSCVQYGIDDWDDAAYAFCVPSIANTWPRRWYPPNPGRNRKPGSPPYTGRFFDGFGNRVTVHAVSNPVISGKEPAALYDRAPGYGIVRFHRDSREIVIECWPRWVDPSQPDAAQYSGWPVRLHQLDNFGRRPAAHLPTIDIDGRNDPVVQIIDEADGEIEYTLRIQGRSFRPPVFGDGPYTVKVGEPGVSWTTLRQVRPTQDAGRRLHVEF